MTELNSNRANTRAYASELRMGLAMSGGIALVLYQTGAAQEILRFTRAWDDSKLCKAYTDAFELIRIRPVLDILTGASAGGINCVLLGHCMATGASFDPFQRAWVENADVQRLKYPEGVPPDSILDRKPLLAEFEESMRRNLEGDIKPDHGLQDLVVRMCRTDFRGHCLTTTDAIGHSIGIQTQTSAAGFVGEDFSSPTTLPRQLLAASATSAFPIAFAPVQDPETTGTWYVDGGLWNNQPLDVAVQIVRDKPAFLKTHRSLFLVQPDPVSTDAGPANAKKPSPGEVLASLPFMGLNGSIWPAVENILDANVRTDLYGDILGEEVVAEALGGYGKLEFQRSLAQLAPMLKNGFQPGNAVTQPSVLNKVRINSVLLDSDPGLIQRWHMIIEKLSVGGISLAGIAQTYTLLGLAKVGWADIARRSIRRRLEQVNTQLHKPEESPHALAQGRIRLSQLNEAATAGAGDASLLEREVELNNAREETVNRKSPLYDQLQGLNDYLQGVQPEPLPQLPIQQNGDLAKTLADMRLSCRRASVQSQDESGFNEASLNPHSRFRPASLLMLSMMEQALLIQSELPIDETMPIILDWWIQDIDNAIGSSVPPAHTAEGAAISTDPGSQLKPKAGMEDIARLFRVCGDGSFGNGGYDIVAIDFARHILNAVSDLTGKSQINLVRISPNDTDNLSLIGETNPTSGTAAKLKLAGERLGHFAGFMDEAWRRNDYIWARLDTAEILLRTLVKLGETEGVVVPEAQYKVWVREAQTSILQEEASLWAGESGLSAQQMLLVGSVADANDEAAGPIIDANKMLIGHGWETAATLGVDRVRPDIQYVVETAGKLFLPHVNGLGDVALGLVEKYVSNRMTSELIDSESKGQ